MLGLRHPYSRSLSRTSNTSPSTPVGLRAWRHPFSNQLHGLAHIIARTRTSICSPGTVTCALLDVSEPAADQDVQEGEQEQQRRDQTLQVHMVQWYPGHIARAERQLKEQLKMVDVVLEVRDARIPVATHHPQVSTWVGPSKLRLLVMNRLDQVSQEDKAAWVQYYKDTKQKMFWTDGKQGDGVQGVKRAMLAASEVINAKRARRGLQSRPVRACVIGFPNIGKSALINRLLGRKAVASYAKPGVTRMLQWVRLEGQLDLLDAPGVIPAAFNDQIAAQRLAICNDIGEAAYVDSIVAAALVQRCRLLPQPSRSRAMAALRARYSLDPEQGSAEEFVVGVANKLFFGEMEKGGQRLLKDYRTGALGAFSLEHPADIDSKRHRDMMLEAAKSGVASSAASEATSVAGGGWIKQTGH